MTTYDDDYLQLEQSARPDLPRVRRIACRELGVHWPPPERIFVDGDVWERQSHSEITDDERATMTHVCRGALYHPRQVDPDRPCEHQNHHVHAAVNRLTAEEGGPVVAYMAEVRIRCADCGEQYRWMGLPAGSSPQTPMVSVDETELRAPIRPATSDPDFGMGLPGFAVRLMVNPDDPDQA